MLRTSAIDLIPKNLYSKTEIRSTQMHDELLYIVAGGLTKASPPERSYSLAAAWVAGL